MDVIYAPARSSEVELVIKKSKFIARVFPVFDVEEAEDRIAYVRSILPDATHTVYAWVIESPSSERASDDGEPRGTAGYPVLEVIKRSGVTNALCTVTRYFGGILLGAGGLVRAYAGAAKEALDRAGKCAYRYMDVVEIRVDYQTASRIFREIESRQIPVDGVSYGESVEYRLLVPPDQEEGLIARLRDLSKGTCQVCVKPGRRVPITP